MNLHELFEKVDAINNTKKAAAARKPKHKPTVLVNEADLPEYLAMQLRAIESGVPQRISRNGYITSHSVFKCLA